MVAGNVTLRGQKPHLHDHAEHHEDIPQSDEDSEVPEAQQELPDVVTCKVTTTKTNLTSFLFFGGPRV
jgi:hypothetical protein